MVQAAGDAGSFFFLVDAGVAVGHTFDEGVSLRIVMSEPRVPNRPVAVVERLDGGERTDRAEVQVEQVTLVERQGARVDVQTCSNVTQRSFDGNRQKLVEGQFQAWLYGLLCVVRDGSQQLIETGSVATKIPVDNQRRNHLGVAQLTENSLVVVITVEVITPQEVSMGVRSDETEVGLNVLAQFGELRLAEAGRVDFGEQVAEVPRGLFGLPPFLGLERCKHCLRILECRSGGQAVNLVPFGEVQVELELTVMVSDAVDRCRHKYPPGIVGANDLLVKHKL